jgi:hypothetical protein
LSRATNLPPEARALALHLGACPDAPPSMVRLRQHGAMRDRPGGRWMRFRARQRIDIRRPQFEWRAAAGPFGCVSVIDSLLAGEAALAVRLLGLLPIAGVRGGAAAAKGEVMRYLAELAWAPDAILWNAALDWTVTDQRTLCVAAGQGPARGEVELRLDEGGRIGEVVAPDRPRKEGAAFVERQWRGRFFDYRHHAGRWLPFAGEVGWVLDGSFVAWHGRLLSWQIR